MKEGIVLINDLNIFFKSITQSNYLDKYEELFTLIKSYKNAYTKEEVSNILYQFYLENKETFEDYKEDVLGEVSNRLSGYSMSIKRIDW